MIRTKRKRSVSRQNKTRKSVRYDGVRVGRTMPVSDVTVGPSNAYASALLAPLSYRSGGARIPDLCTYTTGTVTTQLETTVTANAAGFAGGVLVLSSNGSRYYTNAAGSADTAITFTSATVASGNTWAGGTALGNTLIPGVYDLAASCAGYRIVSAGVQVEFIGNDSNNQGSISGVQLTSIDLADASTNVLDTSAKINNWRRNFTGAAKEGISLRYSPIDAQDLSFGVAKTPATSTFLRTDTTGAVNYGSLQWFAEGLSTTVLPSFRITIRIHHEVIPGMEYYDLDTSISPVSSYQLESAVLASAITPMITKAYSPEKWSKIALKVKGVDKEPSAGKAGQLASIAVDPDGNMTPYDKYGHA